MPRRADIQAATNNGSGMWERGGTQYVVQTPAGVLYVFYQDNLADVAFKKSTDGGLTWSVSTVIFTGTACQLSVWYDKWSGLAGGLIHVAYAEQVNHDVFYRTVDTEASDALSTETTIFAGVSVANGGNVSITRARGGNVYCRAVIDAGAEGGFFRLPNANVPNGAWDAAKADPEALATNDIIILVPGFAADNQDIMGIFWDSSADELSRYVHDDSANTWAETSISTGMVDTAPVGSFPHFAACVDLTNSRIIMAAWSAVDAANADLRCWTVTEAAITETATNVVLNSTDDQGLCAISLNLLNTAEWTVFYVGKSDGSETFRTAINLYRKTTKDSGATWGPESLCTASVTNLPWLITIPRRYLGPPLAVFHSNVTGDQRVMVNLDHTLPRATYVAGVM